jgi:hypothetical protein
MSTKAWLTSFELKGNDLRLFYEFMDWANKEAEKGYFLGVAYTFYSPVEVAGFWGKELLIVAWSTEGSIVIDEMEVQLPIQYRDTRRLDNLAWEYKFWNDKAYFEKWLVKNKCVAFQSPEEIDLFIMKRITANQSSFS